MKSAIFGGTFDPVHNGHIGMARELLKKKLVDSVIFLPAAIPPHKLGENITMGKHRVAMLKVALEAGMELCLWELEREGVKTSYSYETMRELKMIYEDRELIFLMGMDSLNNLGKWKNFSNFIEENEFIVYVRKGQLLPSLDDLSKKLGGKDLACKMLDSVHDLPYFDVSSTLVRERLAMKNSIKDLVPLAVEDVIKRFNLYC